MIVRAHYFLGDAFAIVASAARSEQLIATVDARTRQVWIEGTVCMHVYMVDAERWYLLRHISVNTIPGVKLFQHGCDKWMIKEVTKAFVPVLYSYSNTYVAVGGVQVHKQHSDSSRTAVREMVETCE